MVWALPGVWQDPARQQGSPKQHIFYIMLPMGSRTTVQGEYLQMTLPVHVLVAAGFSECASLNPVLENIMFCNKK